MSDTHATLLKTPLHSLHIEQGGKMVPFAGYDMPVQYDGMGVLKEHLHTRAAAGLFDVSHMGQLLLTSKTADPAIALETIVPGDIQGLKNGQMRYTLLLNDAGGIIDDLIVTRIDAETLFVVVNAACKVTDMAFIDSKIGGAVAITPLPDRALLALQGPMAEAVLTDVLKTPDAAALSFMTALKINHPVYGMLFITRSGYTGEDGFEISVTDTEATALTRALLGDDRVKLIGLGARDSLRLEAGLCLYGHDITAGTTPIEAALNWTIPKNRRARADFPGAAYILSQIEKGTARKRVGIKPDGRAPLREGAELFSLDGKPIGIVTSGGFGPTIDAPVAMGYVDAAYAAQGTAIKAVLRGADRPATVTAMPFITPRYKKDSTKG